MPFADEEGDPIADRLNALPQLEPPAGLRRAVMDAIRRPGIVTQGGDRRRRFAVGWAAAAAVLLAFLLVRPFERAEVPATLAPVASEGVTMSIRRMGSDVRLEITAVRPVTISIRCDPKSAVLVAIPGASDASFRNGLTTFTFEQPLQRAAVVLRPHGDARSANVVVSADGDDVIRAVVPLR